jgi:hypothetical protein
MYTKISDTIAEKTETTERKTKVSLDMLARRKAMLEAQLGKLNAEISELKAIGIKTTEEAKAVEGIEVKA